MKKNPFSKSLLHFLFMAIALALWVLSVNEVKIYHFPPDVFHYLYVLPLSYWVGLSIVLAAFSIRIIYARNFESAIISDLVLIVVVVLFLFGTPSFIEDSPRFFDTYYHAASTVAVKLSGKTGPSLAEVSGAYAIGPAYSYPQNYPGFFTLFAILLNVTGMPLIAVLNYYPIALMGTISLFIYTIARVFSRRCSIIAPVFFLSMAWFQAFHISPESLGIILYLMIFLCITKLSMISKESTHIVQLPWSLVNLLAISSVVISHQATSIFLILNLGLLSALMFGQKLVKSYILPKNIFRVFAIVSVFFFAWSSFVAQFSFTLTVKSASQAISGILMGSAPSLKSVIWSHGLWIVNKLREAEILITNFLGLVSMFLIFRNRSDRKVAVWLGGWLVSCWIFVVYPLFTQGEYIERPAMYALIPVSVLMSFCTQHVKTGHLRKIFMTTSILIVSFSSLCLPLVRNANDSFETPSTSSLSASSFAVSNANASIAYAGPTPSLLALYYCLSLKQEHGRYLFDEGILSQKSDLIMFDDQAYAYALNYGNQKQYVSAQHFANTILPRIYDNEGAEIYVNIFLLLNLTQMQK